MARVQVGFDPRPEGLQTTAQTNVATEQARFDPRANSAAQLAEALGKAQPVLDRFQEGYERERLKDQLLKEGAYKEQFMQDYQGGAVTAAQIKERFPDTVPIVAARVAQSIGLEHGRKSVNSIIDEINQRDDLRLDSAKRNEFIAQKRKEFVNGLGGKDNEFFLSGAASGFDQEVRGWENGWQRETANYHGKVQSEAFADEVGRTLLAGGNLEEVDKKWSQSSSLNNLERKKLVVDTVMQKAYATDDPSLLKKIPTVFLNDEFKKTIKAAEIQIQQLRIQKVRDAQFLENVQREEQTRGAKTDIVQKLATGKQVNPADYRGNPEAFNFAMQMKDQAILPDTLSVANATRARTAILNGSTVGTMSQNQVIDQIMANPAINPKEKQKLIDDVPKLLEGMLIMKDESVTNAMTNRLDPVIKAIETGPFNKLFQVQGINIRGQALSMFQSNLQQSMQAWFEDPKLGNGQQWPVGVEKQRIINEAIQATENNITKMTEMYTKSGGTQAPAPATARPGNTPARSQPSQADIDFAKKNPQFRQQFINTFGREP
jgi:hypothetical protein